MRVLIFEQDALHVEPDQALDKDYVCRWLGCDEEDEKIIRPGIVTEYEDNNTLILQAFNDEGESWKFIGLK